MNPSATEWPSANALPSVPTLPSTGGSPDSAETPHSTNKWPSTAELLSTLHVVALPLRTRFRGIEVREASLLRGPEGWTEFAPFLEYPDAAAATWLAAAIDYGWRQHPPLLRDRIGVNATLPAVSAERVAEILDRYPGARTVKIKVAEPGEDAAAEEARIRAARTWLGDEGRIRLDANGLWSVTRAEERLLRYQRYGLEYAEQPCASVSELAELRTRLAGSGILIAADESVRRTDDPLAVARAGAADLLVVKAAPLGGIRRALALVAEAGLPAVVSSALDTSVGLSMGLHLAGSLPGLSLDCGLGTAALLAADVTTEPLLPEASSLPVRGVPVSEELLHRHAASPERMRWWRERIRRCHAHLAQR